jgi:hypothetical protein
MAFYKGDRQGRAKRGVLQIDYRGAMPFDCAQDAADAMGVSKCTIHNWILDKREHRGFRWEYERVKR